MRETMTPPMELTEADVAARIAAMEAYFLAQEGAPTPTREALHVPERPVRLPAGIGQVATGASAPEAASSFNFLAVSGALHRTQGLVAHHGNAIGDSMAELVGGPRTPMYMTTFTI